MSSVHLKVDYSNLEKPVELIERQHSIGGTDYTHIANVSVDHAVLLNVEGISWLYGEPDWEDFYREIKVRKLQRERREIEAKLRAYDNQF